MRCEGRCLQRPNQLGAGALTCRAVHAVAHYVVTPRLRQVDGEIEPAPVAASSTPLEGEVTARQSPGPGVPGKRSLMGESRQSVWLQQRYRSSRTVLTLASAWCNPWTAAQKRTWARLPQGRQHSIIACAGPGGPPTARGSASRRRAEQTGPPCVRHGTSFCVSVLRGQVARGCWSGAALFHSAADRLRPAREQASSIHVEMSIGQIRMSPMLV